jgi:hypothetical protein
LSTPDPHAPQLLTVTKAEAAQSQLETAITLWFNYGDLVSILNLANAANDCYRALGGHAGHKSIYAEWYKSQSTGIQDRIRDVQNWIKHGLKKTTKKAEIPSRLAEVLILDSADCHTRLFGTPSVLMSFWVTRFMLETAGIWDAKDVALLRQGLDVYEIADGNRTEFLNKAWERLRTIAGSAQ